MMEGSAATALRSTINLCYPLKKRWSVSGQFSDEGQMLFLLDDDDGDDDVGD